MPRRDDLHKILIIGSGPIVIGQACEFDYSGTQACKVLADEGYEVVLVNSNPATIMTDPDFAARTYIEPLDLPTLTRIIEIERPDALLPTLGGQTALNLAIELKESGILDLWEVEMIGADADAIRRAEDRSGVPHRHGGDRPARAAQRDRDLAGRRRAGRQRPRPASCRTPRLHPGRRRRRHRPRPREPEAGGRERPAPEPHHAGDARGVGRRVARVRARGHARPGRQRGGHLFHRERRSHGRAHGRQRHRGTRAHADRRPVPGAARRGQGDHPQDRGGHRRLQRAVRRAARDRRGRGHRDEPAGLAQLGARLQGDRFSDRQDRRQAGRRLHARRDPQRHHSQDAGELRAHARLHRRQDAALGLREVPHGRHRADHAHEERRRGDGHRTHLQGGLPQGSALTRARRRAEPAARAQGAREGAVGALVRALRAHTARLPPGLHGRRDPRAHGGAALLPGGARRHRRARRRGAARRAGARRRSPAPPQALRLLRPAPGRALRHERARGSRGPPRARHRAGLQGGRHLRRRVRSRDALLLLDLRGRERGPARGARTHRHSRQRTQPHRSGHRVRLLLRACRHDRARERLRRRHGELQSRDRLDRLRHLRPAVLRASHLRGRRQHLRERAAQRRDRAVRRPDAAAHRPRARNGRHRHPGHTPGGNRPGRRPRPVRHAARRARHQLPHLRRRARPRRGARDRAAHRLPVPRAALLRARRAGHGDRLLERRARPLRRHRRQREPRSPDPDRQVPRGRDRGRRRRPVGRRRGVHRRHHAARRRGRRALRRLVVRAALDLARRGHARAGPPPDARAGPGARRAKAS